MRVKTVQVNNFRLLHSIKINLDDTTTIIVGRNNSGKTSLIEVFHRFLGRDKINFDFEDFSAEVFEASPSSEIIQNFHLALQKYKQFIRASVDEKEDAEKEFRAAIPQIEAKLLIEYEETDDLASLSNFIMDLDPARKDVLISCEYGIRDPLWLFKDFEADSKFQDIVAFLQKRYRHYYQGEIYAIDAQNPSNRYLIEKKHEIEDVFLPKFIYAQRALDDQAADNQKNLSKGFEQFYRLNSDGNEDVEAMEKSLQSTAEELDEKYKGLFKGLFDDLGSFGVNTGLSLQELIIKAQLDPEKVLKGNTKLFYKHGTNSLLPESYNGLGFSNLIYIILQFISFFEEYSKRKPIPSFQVLFVEEPEAHFHPQMQQTFIRNINTFIEDKGWPLQVVITTHSSHIIAESGFDCIRYFDHSQGTLRVKNLCEFKNDQEKKNKHTIKFLRQYLSISNCDMFFADKIILIEGVVERLLLPTMIKKVSPGLSAQYVSIIEVGGAYAYRFKELLKFLNVKTLIITDIDSVDKNQKRKACKVVDTAVSSNQTLVQWLPKEEEIKTLLSCGLDAKTDDRVRVSYQVPEADKNPTGRSFEEAFILKNASAFHNHISDEGIEIKLVYETLFLDDLDTALSADNIVSQAYEIAGKIKKKSDFAFDISLLKDWKVPRYIEEGLVWLEKNEEQ